MNNSSLVTGTINSNSAGVGTLAIAASSSVVAAANIGGASAGTGLDAITLASEDLL